MNHNPDYLRSTGRLLAIALWSLYLLGMPLAAADKARIAVIEFELKDLTPLPATQQELARTASLKPLLDQALKQNYGYEHVIVDANLVREADAGIGYLFDHHNLAAEVGRRLQANWIVVGRVHKPSFLFAYLMVHLVNVETGHMEQEIIVEVKGPQDRVTAKGAERLAEKIHAIISR
ncbi:MAG: DUF2380 domain-containing protein [Gammaproteobacteria bacterium]|nr:DUF2380 domain-containing protein [Gammaproteobacteria bacterium]